VEQLITNHHDRFVNRFRSQGNYVCQALIMSFKFVSFLSSTAVHLYLLVLFVLNCYAECCGGEIKLYNKWTYIRNVMHYALVIVFRLTSSYACDIFFLCWFTTLVTNSSILRLSSKEPRLMCGGCLRRHFTKYQRVSRSGCSGSLSPVYTIQPVVNPVVKPV